MTGTPRDGATPILDFPLRGEWRALNSPATGDGHGTDYLGQRWAIDFSQMDADGTWFYASGARGLLVHATVGIAASRFRCWDQPVHAAAAGRVVAARDAWPDRMRVQLAWEIVRSRFARAKSLTRDDLRPLAGNYVLVEGDDGVACYGHLRRDSVRVKPDDRVEAGDVLGAVGNSGNSTMPHLHFHLMDSADALAARGVPFAFRGYERWSGDAWERVAFGIPGSLERIRATGR